MKSSRILIVGTCAAFAFTGIVSSTAFAEEKEGAEMKMTIPATIEGIMTEIHTHQGELADVVKAKKLSDVHHHAFAIRDLVAALPDKVTADKKAHVEGSVKNIAKLAGELDESGDANNQALTETTLKKFDAVLMVLMKQIM